MTKESSEKEGTSRTKQSESAWLEVFEVLYSPFKAFKKIVEKPSIKGPLLILVIILVLTAGAQYVWASKISLETDSPGTTVSLISMDRLIGLIAAVLPGTGISFLLQWIVYVGILLLVMQLSGEEIASWSAFFIIMGYIFSVVIIYYVVSILLFATLPTITLPLKIWPPSTAAEDMAVRTTLDQVWGSRWEYQAGPYINYGITVWMAVLSSVAMRTLSKLTWRKALIIAAVAASANFVFKFFLS